MKKLFAALAVMMFSLLAFSNASAQEAGEKRPTSWLAEHPFNDNSPGVGSDDPILIERQPKVKPLPSSEKSPVQEPDNDHKIPARPKLLRPDQPDCDGVPASQTPPEAFLARFPAIALSAGDKLPAPPSNLKKPSVGPHTQALPHPMPAPPVVGTRSRPVPGHFNGKFTLPNQTTFYRGFFYNRNWYGHQFYAHHNYAPTEYFYFVSGGYWWGPNLGYSWQVPATQGPITIAVIENVQVVVWNPRTRTYVVQTQQVLWYYNAYYYQGLGWIYQDMHGVIHRLSW